MKIRSIDAAEIIYTVKQLCIEANMHLPADVQRRLSESANRETDTTAKAVLQDLCENCNAARELSIPVCQDTGMAVVFVTLGNRCVVEGMTVEEAVNEGVRQGYLEGGLRLSVVSDPLERVNTKDNTPAVIYINTASGDQIELTVLPKGFGSENMSRLKMFTPAATQEDIVRFVTESVVLAASNPCPPVVVGVGIGGTFDYCAYLAKKALGRPLDTSHPKPLYAKLEEECLQRINATGIGPQGFGGKTTALKVQIETFATHIAGLPVAVNMGCYIARHKTAII